MSFRDGSHAASSPATNVEGRLSHDSCGSVVPRRLAELAGRQRGVVSLAQMRALGLGSRQVDYWLLCGRLHALHEGVYAVGHRALPRGGHFLAAVLAGGEGAALSHASAAAHLGLRPSRASVVDVMVPRSGERARDGIRFHRPKIYGPEDVRIHDGIPTTTMARTLVDLASVVRFEPLELAVEQAERLGVLDVKAIAEVLARISRPRGVRNLRRCLGPDRLDASRTRSNLERKVLKLCRDGGIPRPLLNHPIEVAPGDFLTVDLYWPAARLAVEIDSWKFHGTPAAARRDRRRDRELRNVGVRVERFMDADIDEEPLMVAAAFRRLLAQSRDD